MDCHLIEQAWIGVSVTKNSLELLTILNKSPDLEILAHGVTKYRSKDLLSKITEIESVLDEAQVCPGDVIHLIADYSIAGVASILALYQKKCILIPQVPEDADQKKGRIIEATADFILTCSADDTVTISRRISTEVERNTNELLQDLKNGMKPGLILFTSGTTGEPKGVVHDFELLLSKFSDDISSLKPFRSVSILMFDHWGGLNTLFHSLYSGGFLALVNDRKPDTIAEAIENHKLNLLPASPSFLNIFLLKGSFNEYNLSSLRWITYGAEPMPQSTLDRMNLLLPGIKFKQTYGLIEIGVLSTTSESNSSTLIKLGGAGFEVRVVDHMLEIRAKTSMLGYLNAESPFTKDGFFKTGDVVEEHGEYLKILGRKSNLIITGGEKVYPSEIESVILECEWVSDARVFGVPHPLLGKVIAVEIQTSRIDEPVILRSELRSFCSKRLSNFKVPMIIEFSRESLVNMRLKKERK
jgi:acyl-CoA synthetase (AMP-forming)/AMP-acid ligase II